MKYELEDGFLAQKILKKDKSVHDRAKEIINLIIQGREQVITGKLGYNAVDASDRYLQFVYYMKEQKLEEDEKSVLFDLITFSGNYLDYWEWLVDQVVSYTSHKFYGERG